MIIGIKKLDPYVLKSLGSEGKIKKIIFYICLHFMGHGGLYVINNRLINGLILRKVLWYSTNYNFNSEMMNFISTNIWARHLLKLLFQYLYIQ